MGAVLGQQRHGADIGRLHQPAEVAIAGRIAIHGREAPIVGQIDRLAETQSDILIADFKTGKPDGMPASYATQLALYQAAVAQLYPGRSVRALLVWTQGPQVIELTAGMAQDALARLR